MVLMFRFECRIQKLFVKPPIHIHNSVWSQTGLLLKTSYERCSTVFRMEHKPCETHHFSHLRCLETPKVRPLSFEVTSLKLVPLSTHEMDNMKQQTIRKQTKKTTKAKTHERTWTRGWLTTFHVSQDLDYMPIYRLLKPKKKKKFYNPSHNNNISTHNL